MKKFFSALVLGSAFSVSAFAAPVLTAPTLSTEDFVVIAVAVLGALAVMWGIKKGLALLRG
ncbi:MAG: hypothetical protein LBU73_02175 [Helicobacteraceae bacterium]|nr:hypothetical protein [Helicobacteraceae bacterium]